MSMASAAKGFVAGNSLMNASLCVPVSRFFAQVGRTATHPNTSLASEG